MFGKTALSIMIMVPAARFWRDYGFSEHIGDLQTLVPGWPELNDALYWTSIKQARSAKMAKSGEPLTDDWSVSWLGHFWKFDISSLPRLLDYMRSRSLQDDRMVALSTAFRVFVQADRPTHILNSLQGAVVYDPALQQQLDKLLNPPVSETMRKQEKERAKYQRQREIKDEQEKHARETWIAELRANPDRVRNPSNLKIGEITYDQYWLMLELQDLDLATDRSEYANWQALISEFGEVVARAYRDAAVNHWRHYLPTLWSEGVQDNGTSYSLIFAMAGLEIEATESNEFLRKLDEAQVRHVLRYITSELNGFPIWFDRLYQLFPALVEETVIRELVWEMENTEPEKPMHYILSDVVYHAPWLHAAIAPRILEWLESNPTRTNVNIEHYMHILVNGGTDPAKLSLLAKQQIDNINDPDIISIWYALLVDCDPVKGIPELDKWLAGLDEEVAKRAAQIFITWLIGERRVGGYPHVESYRTANHLKKLYVLMHKYVSTKEDINRIGGGGYSPTLRDKAQDARNRLFSLLSSIPGKASYLEIKQLANEHPEPDYRPWMAKQAYKRAEEDGNLEPWSAEQVSNYDRTQTLKPETHRQLYELTVRRLHDLRNWLERGNNSPYQTWQRAEDETEMRKLIAGWLNQQRHNQYLTAQEPELANSQRMDIWLQNTNVKSPIPIELKLLDKKWSGPKLCERLRNQLAGDYLREESAGCGVMLLVWQGRIPAKRWNINGRYVRLSELDSVMKLYWQSIAAKFPGVEEIDVIVIDLSTREQISES